jgi:methyl-accepting chemotaxis protein
MNLRDLNIGTRLGLGFGVILLSTSAMLAGALLSSNASRHQMLDTLEKATAQENEAVSMRHSLLASAVAVRNMGLQTEVDGVQKDEAEAKLQRSRYLAAKGRLEAMGLREEDKAIFGRLAQIDQQMEAGFKEAVDLAAQFNTEQAGKIITGQIDPLLTKASTELAAFIELQKQRTAAATEQANTTSERTQWAAASLGALLIALAGLMAWRITVSITRPLQAAAQASARGAQGDLVSEIKVDGHDEAAQLLKALGAMRDSLARMVSNVRTSAESINGASAEIASGNADLSSRTESQASALQETASSVEQLTSTVKQNAQNALQAQSLSQGAAEQTRKGHAVVTQVVQTMNAINESSRKIGDITSVINGIAFQTNILALNAAVEAARAGEHGRGFAVVAAEVRTLSQRTTTAAKEIETLIRQASERTEAGTVLVDAAGREMNGVMESVRQVAEIIGAISLASHEQTSGIEQVNGAIADIDRTTQQNAALVEEASAAATSMRDQTRRLTEMVAEFSV